MATPHIQEDGPYDLALDMILHQPLNQLIIDD
jgi:hypothetical protein